MRGLAPPSVIHPERDESSVVTCLRLCEIHFRRKVYLCAPRITYGLVCLTCFGFRRKMRIAPLMSCGCCLSHQISLKTVFFPHGVFMSCVFITTNSENSVFGLYRSLVFKNINLRTVFGKTTLFRAPVTSRRKHIHFGLIGKVLLNLWGQFTLLQPAP
jgi:hypothetical protein